MLKLIGFLTKPKKPGKDFKASSDESQNSLLIMNLVRIQSSHSSKAPLTCYFQEKK